MTPKAPCIAENTWRWNSCYSSCNTCPSSILNTRGDFRRSSWSVFFIKFWEVCWMVYKSPGRAKLRWPRNELTSKGLIPFQQDQCFWLTYIILKKRSLRKSYCHSYKIIGGLLSVLELWVTLFLNFEKCDELESNWFTINWAHKQIDF